MFENRVVIVGGGISGLAAAYFVSKRGVRPVILEKASRLGGLIRTNRLAGCDLEAGPDSFLAAKTSVAELAAELGSSNRIIPSNDSKRRVFIARRSGLIPLPHGMVMIAPSEWSSALKSPLFNPQTKLGFVREFFRKPQTRGQDISISLFVRQHFGAEVLENVAEPLLTGVYGGDPGNLSVQSVLPRFLAYEREFGSLIRGVRSEHRKRTASTFQSFEGGMQTLVDLLEQVVRAQAEIRHTEVRKLSGEGAGWKVDTDSGTLEASQVVLAVPAHVGARLLKANPDLSTLLDQIPYSSAILVTFLFEDPNSAPQLDGFGLLVPIENRQTIAAATWTSMKFPSRTPGGKVAVRVFIVGQEALQLAAASDETIVSAAQDDLSRILGRQLPSCQSAVVRWPDSMPQYVVGHKNRVEEIQRLAALLPGLHFCGNAFHGVGIPNCVRLAKEVAGNMKLS